MARNILLVSEDGRLHLTFDGVAYKQSQQDGYVFADTAGSLSVDMRHCDLSVDFIGAADDDAEDRQQAALLARFARFSAFMLLVIASTWLF